MGVVVLLVVVVVMVGGCRCGRLCGGGDGGDERASSARSMLDVWRELLAKLRMAAARNLGGSFYSTVRLRVRGCGG